MDHQLTTNHLPLIAIVGETASGKTAAGIKVAQEVGGEIICADSRTVYKQMNIGTAKPTKKEQRLVPHHLIDVLDPNEEFNVAQFQRLAHKCIQDIHSRNKVPIMVGGTGLYIDSVLYNFQLGAKADAVYRAVLEQMNDEELTTILNTKNINTVNLNTKNRRHVIRAIERDKEVPNDTNLRSNTLVLGISLDREVLLDKVTKRTERMFNDGLLAEVENLTTTYGKEVESFKTPEYSACIRYLNGQIDLKQAKQSIISADLQYAKRQRTWFKRNQHIQWFKDPEELVGRAIAFSIYGL